MVDGDASAKLKHFSAQVAMVAQSPASPHGFALCGQQSSAMADMSGVDMSLDISTGAGDLEPAPALAAVGNVATDRAIIRAKIVRPMRMGRANERHVSPPSVRRSSYDFASGPVAVN